MHHFLTLLLLIAIASLAFTVGIILLGGILAVGAGMYGYVALKRYFSDRAMFREPDAPAPPKHRVHSPSEPPPEGQVIIDAEFQEIERRR